MSAKKREQRRKRRLRRRQLKHFTFPKDILSIIYNYRDSMDYGVLLNYWLKIVQRDTDKCNCETPYEICTLIEDDHSFVHAIRWTFSLLTSSVTELFDEYTEFATKNTQDVPFYINWSTGNRSKDITLTRSLFIKEIIPKVLSTIYKHPLYEPLPIGLPEFREQMGLGSLITEQLSEDCRCNGLITPEVHRIIIEAGIRLAIEMAW